MSLGAQSGPHHVNSPLGVRKGHEAVGIMPGAW